MFLRSLCPFLLLMFALLAGMEQVASDWVRFSLDLVLKEEMTGTEFPFWFVGVVDLSCSLFLSSLTLETGNCLFSALDFVELLSLHLFPFLPFSPCEADSFPSQDSDLGKILFSLTCVLLLSCFLSYLALGWEVSSLSDEWESMEVSLVEPDLVGEGGFCEVPLLDGDDFFDLLVGRDDGSHLTRAAFVDLFVIEEFVLLAFRLKHRKKSGFNNNK